MPCEILQGGMIKGKTKTLKHTDFRIDRISGRSSVENQAGKLTEDAPAGKGTPFWEIFFFPKKYESSLVGSLHVLSCGLTNCFGPSVGRSPCLPSYLPLSADCLRQLRAFSDSRLPPAPYRMPALGFGSLHLVAIATGRAPVWLSASDTFNFLCKCAHQSHNWLSTCPQHLRRHH